MGAVPRGGGCLLWRGCPREGCRLLGEGCLRRRGYPRTCLLWGGCPNLMRLLLWLLIRSNPQQLLLPLRLFETGRRRGVLLPCTFTG